MNFSLTTLINYVIVIILFALYYIPLRMQIHQYKLSRRCTLFRAWAGPPLRQQMFYVPYICGTVVFMFHRCFFSLLQKSTAD